MGWAAFKIAFKQNPKLRRSIKESRRKRLTNVNMIDEINNAFNASNIANTKAIFESLFLDGDKQDNYHLGNLMPELVPSIPKELWYWTCNQLDRPVRRMMERVVVRTLKRPNPIPLKVTTVKLPVNAPNGALNFSIQEVEYPIGSRALNIYLAAKWLANNA